MKISILIVALVSLFTLASCDVQSGITKKSVEKFEPTPTPSVSQTPAEAPIDPADVVTVSTTEPGPVLLASSYKDKKGAMVCDKYNRVMVNRDGNVVTVRGACSQIMINGNGNDVTADGVAEIIFNGTENKVRYSRIVNGKRPTVTDNAGGNISEKIARSDKK